MGILSTNTPAFLESIFGIGGAGAVNVAINYRLKKEDIEYIFEHADVDSIIVDAEFEHLLQGFRERFPRVPFIVDTDTDTDSGPYDQAVQEGLQYDEEHLGGRGWEGLETEVADEESLIALSYTSGTTAKPKGVEFTHRSAYLAALANVIESNLNTHISTAERCHYLWTLPMFHAMGWTFPWAVTAVRGTHYCLRKVDYPEIWRCVFLCARCSASRPKGMVWGLMLRQWLTYSWRRLLKHEAISHYNAAPTVSTLLCQDENAEKLPGKSLSPPQHRPRRMRKLTIAFHPSQNPSA